MKPSLCKSRLHRDCFCWIPPAALPGCTPFENWDIKISSFFTARIDLYSSEFLDVGDEHQVDDDEKTGGAEETGAETEHQTTYIDDPEARDAEVSLRVPRCRFHAGASRADGLEWLEHAVTGQYDVPHTAEAESTPEDLLAAALHGKMPQSFGETQHTPSLPSSSRTAAAPHRVGASSSSRSAKTAGLQARRGSVGTSRVTPGGWLTVGRLGLPPADDGDNDDAEDNCRNNANTLALSTSTRGSRSTDSSHHAMSLGAGAPAPSTMLSNTPCGWLAAAVASGSLGAPGADEPGVGTDIDDDTDDGRYPRAARTAVKTATVSTQWEDGVRTGSSTRSRLPPWAKIYTAPPCDSENSGSGPAPVRAPEHVGNRRSSSDRGISSWTPDPQAASKIAQSPAMVTLAIQCGEPLIRILMPAEGKNASDSRTDLEDGSLAPATTDIILVPRPWTTAGDDGVRQPRWTNEENISENGDERRRPDRCLSQATVVQGYE